MGRKTVLYDKDRISIKAWITYFDVYNIPTVPPRRDIADKINGL